MRIERRHTTAGQSPYSAIPFRSAVSEIRNPDGSIVFRLEGIEVPEANGHVFNVGTGEPTDVLTVAKTLMDKYNKKVNLYVSGNFRIGDIRHNYADITAAREILGFEPKWNFSDGIARFTSWVDSQKVCEDKYEQSIKEMKDKNLFK